MICEFVVDSYKKTLEIFGWVVVVLSALLGAYQGYLFADMAYFIPTLGDDLVNLILGGVLGFFIGILGGFIFNAIVLPPALLLLEIRDSLKK